MIVHIYHVRPLIRDDHCNPFKYTSETTVCCCTKQHNCGVSPFLWVFTKLVIAIPCFKFYMSKGRQFQYLSTGMFRLTTSTCTIKLQSKTASQVMNTSQVQTESAEVSSSSFIWLCVVQPQSCRQRWRNSHI